MRFWRRSENRGLEVGRTFRKIAARVDELTRGAQLPETSISLLGDFYFVPPGVESEEHVDQAGKVASLPHSAGENAVSDRDDEPPEESVVEKIGDMQNGILALLDHARTNFRDITGESYYDEGGYKAHFVTQDLINCRDNIWHTKSGEIYYSCFNFVESSTDFDQVRKPLLEKASELTGIFDANWKKSTNEDCVVNQDCFFATSPDGNVVLSLFITKSDDEDVHNGSLEINAPNDSSITETASGEARTDLQKGVIALLGHADTRFSEITGKKHYEEGEFKAHYVLENFVNCSDSIWHKSRW